MHVSNLTNKLKIRILKPAVKVVITKVILYTCYQKLIVNFLLIMYVIYGHKVGNIILTRRMVTSSACTSSFVNFCILSPQEEKCRDEYLRIVTLFL